MYVVKRSINRNIVECKDFHQPFCDCAISVLIETLWNVKLFTISFILMSISCINRNIVECKGQMRQIFLLPKEVLIETLWNVKSTNHCKNTQLFWVLIETLWNVKTEISVNDEIIWSVLIETLWNVKEDTDVTMPVEMFPY